MFALVILGPDGVSARYELGPTPLVVGRAPECDVVLAHPSVSRRHVTFWSDGDGVWVEDLKSRNGTWVGETRLEDRLSTGPGTRLRIGDVNEVRIDPSSVVRKQELLFALEEPATQLRVVLGADPVYVGTTRRCRVQLPSGPEVAAVVALQRGAEVWLGRDDDWSELTLDAPFQVGGREFVVRQVPSSAAPTVSEVGATWNVRVDLDAAGGPLATVHNASERVDVAGGNGAVLLYVLARAWTRDAERGLGDEDRGWIDDDDAAVAVWGKGGPLKQLSVVVCRLRQRLREGGVDPWIIERRRGALRVHVRSAELVS